MWERDGADFLDLLCFLFVRCDFDDLCVRLFFLRTGP